MTLAGRLQAGDVLYLRADVRHARRGALRHAFRYRADFVLLAPETMRPPALLAHNRFGLMGFRDADHGGVRGAGRGAPWAWEQFAAAGMARRPGMVLGLLAQPRFLGHWFNPVSFWMVLEEDRLLAVIAEVNNTFGQRHSYLCHAPAFAPIAADTPLRAAKVFHVSPFQDVRGAYNFGFALHPDRIAIRIRQIDGANGLEAAMSGRFSPLGNRAILRAALARPGGSLRVLALIYWHALRLKMKGAAYHKLPAPPEDEISR